MIIVEAPLVPSKRELLEALGGSLEKWARKCHQASLCLIRSGVFGGQPARVARGFARGVSSQHSWVVLGGDCYAPTAQIVDPTLWSYVKTQHGIWIGRLEHGVHEPHGAGSIWTWGKPRAGNEEPIKLTPKRPLSKEAQRFLKLVGPLDRVGWQTLAQAPVEGWPAGEILAAMDDTKALRVLVPIDRLGMLTDRNPGNLYW